MKFVSPWPRRLCTGLLLSTAVLVLPGCATLRVLLLPRSPSAGPAGQPAAQAVAPSGAERALLCGAARVLQEAGFSTAALGDRVLANRRLLPERGRVELLAGQYEVETDPGHEGPAVLRLALSGGADGLSGALSTAGFSMSAAAGKGFAEALRSAASDAAASAECAPGRAGLK